MHEPESILKIESYEILWYFDIKTNHLIPARRPGLVITTKKKNLLYCGFCCSSSPQSENQRKRKKRQVLGPCQITEKVVERVGDGDTNCNWFTWNSP